MALSRGIRVHQYLDDWLIRAQSREEGQLNTHIMVDRTQSLGWIINQDKSELQPTQLFSFVGYQYHLDSALVKHDRQMAQDLILKIKSNREDGPRGSPSHETFSVGSQGTLEISPVIGHPPSLIRDHISPPRMVAKPCQCSEGIRPSFQRPQYPALYQRLKCRLGCSLRARLLKWAVVRRRKIYTYSAGDIRQHNSGSLHKQTGGNPLGRHVRSPVENHDLVPPLQNNPTGQAHSRMPECNGRCTSQVKPDSVDRVVTPSAGFQTTLPKVVHPSCRPVCHSAEPQAPAVCIPSPRPTCLGHT